MSETKKSKTIEGKAHTKEVMEPTSVPLASAIEGVRRVMLPSLRTNLIKSVSGGHLESLSSGGPLDPIEAILEGRAYGKLSTKPDWAACHWYVMGIAEALGLSSEEVLESVRAYVPEDYPNPVRRFINTRRKRLGLSPYTG